VVVPGNHDVPLYNIFARFLSPLDKFRKYITDELMPEFIDEQVAIMGVSTARSLTIKGGRINMEHVSILRQRFCNLPDGLIKIVVTHHPFDLPAEGDRAAIVGRAGEALPQLLECGADVFLAGHMHTSSVMPSAKRYQVVGGRIALLIQAGTAVSDRARGEAQSFNIIEADDGALTVNTMSLIDSRFQKTERKSYSQGHNGWERAA
jgi:3',5'-cyclic AMP phosphodiesterase CpdA